MSSRFQREELIWCRTQVERKEVNARPIQQENCAVYVDRLLLVLRIPCAVKSVPMLYPKTENTNCYRLFWRCHWCNAHYVVLYNSHQIAGIVTFSWYSSLHQLDVSSIEPVGIVLTGMRLKHLIRCLYYFMTCAS